MPKAAQTISMIGDGGWGTTLAILLAEKGFSVTLWGAFPKYTSEMIRTRENRKFLPGVKIPASVILTNDLEKAIERGSMIVLATPSQYLPDVLEKIKAVPSYQKKHFVNVTKGIDLGSFLTMSQLVQKELGRVAITTLSGPTIAIEVARKIPTTAVAASPNPKLAKEVQSVFSCDHFRVYTNPDIIGVELCGSVKNVIALACGVCDGLGLGTNTKAALLTRGLVEITRLGRALKANPETFSGLAGLGDLATTCFSPNSRNRSLGCELGKGRSLKKILASMDAVAEGVMTAKSVYRLARKLGIEMPITQAVYGILYKNHSPRKAVASLMGRTLKKE